MIVLDTHTWIWWLSDPDQLPERSQKLIAECVRSESVYVSSISTWEVAMLVSRSRLRLAMDVRDWVARSEALDSIHFVPVDNVIALRAIELLEPFHSDPADRLIVATALTVGAQVVSKDRKIRDYPHVEAIWA